MLIALLPERLAIEENAYRKPRGVSKESFFLQPVYKADKATIARTEIMERIFFILINLLINRKQN